MRGKVSFAAIDARRVHSRRTNGFTSTDTERPYVEALETRRYGDTSLTFYAGALSVTEAEAVAVGLSLGSWDWTQTKTAPPADERRAPLTAVSDARAARARSRASA